MTPADRRAAATLAAACLVGAVGWPTSAGSGAAANQWAAQRETHRLLSMFRVPSGARELRSVPSSLPRAITGTPAVDWLAQETRSWRVDSPFEETLAWVRTHPPAGLANAGAAYGSDGDVRTAGDGHGEPDTGQWV